MYLQRATAKVARSQGGGGRRQKIGSRAVIPAPTMGLNTRDPVAAMKPEYAIELTNYFPDHGAVRLRKGSREYAEGVGTGNVETLIEQYADADARFFGIGGGAIYDITNTANAALPIMAGTALKSGLTSSRWSWANIGGHIVMVSGEDDPERILPDGTLAPAHGWTGLTEVDELNTVTAFKNRLFFTRKNSAKIYYGGTSFVQGPLVEFDLGFVLAQGGNAIQIGAMTVDAGQGIDDLFLVFMQHGIVLVYSGIDPASPQPGIGFSLVGQFKIGELVGDRPLVNVGGDLFVHTVDGVMSMEKVLRQGRSGQKGVSVSDAIVPSIREQAAIYGESAGWDSILHPPASWLIFSGPVPGGEQYCMNTRTFAWCRFAGMDAKCWGRFDDKLYYGGAGGKVWLADTGTADGDVAITGDVQTAFNYLGTAMDKRFTLARSVVETDANIQIRLGATADFANPVGGLVPTNIVVPAGEWDVAQWDVSLWGGGSLLLREWKMLNEIGTALSVRLQSETSGANVALFATDCVYEKAPGIL